MHTEQPRSRHLPRCGPRRSDRGQPGAPVRAARPGQHLLVYGRAEFRKPRLKGSADAAVEDHSFRVDHGGRGQKLRSGPFVGVARFDRLHTVWRLSLLALRPEEVAGLRWESVDLAAGTLTVARIQVIVAGKVIERETAKTPAGERTLPLGEGTVAALRELPGSSARNASPPAGRTRLAATAATWPPTRPAPAAARSGRAAPSTASWPPPALGRSPSTTPATPRCPTCSTRVRYRSPSSTTPAASTGA